jgi:PAS domain S-box-containing protein
MPHTGTHDYNLVALSILIAMFASYTALDLAARIQASAGWVRSAWLGSAAVAMGGGIWSMHFIGMLAFRLPGLNISYDLTLTFLSLILPITVTAFGFFVASRRGTGPISLTLSGLVMGLGIAGMHYTGMAAMQMPADLSHEPLWVAISILTAIGAATIALWLTFKRTSSIQRLLAAAAMGLAVSGMHYAAMQGARFTIMVPMDHAGGHTSVGQTSLALWVTATTILILVLALVAATYDRHFARLAEREAASLRRSEERFRVLIEGVTDYAIFMVDPRGRITNWNTGAQRIKGYRAEEIIGSHFSRFYTDEDLRAGVPDRALKTAELTGKFEAEGWRLRRDGSRFWASVVIDPIRNEGGELIGFAKVTRDITERKLTQEALEKTREALAQAQKMEAVGQLTGGVAHDFNNLLMAVLGSLALLKKRLPDDPKMIRLLDNAVQGAQRGVALTQRMLAFARRQDLKPEAVDLPDLVRGMTDLLKGSIGPAIQIETRFPLEVPKVMVDANQLELALLNLVVNARDAMPRGGTITIGAREDHQGKESGFAIGRHVCLSVADTGEGMDDETLGRAQEPFFTTKGVGKGTGLGLSMVHGLAEQSNGRLVLKSRKGQGTTAEIWLPVTDATQAVERQAPVETGLRESAEAASPQKALTILIVDDDPLVLENAAAMLEDLGHRVIEAHSGEEALALTRSVREIDLIITDHVMPGMTGLELMERIKISQPQMRFLLATGYAELPPGSQSALHKLNKPFDQAILANAIEAAMGRLDAKKVVVPFRTKGG